MRSEKKLSKVDNTCALTSLFIFTIQRNHLSLIRISCRIKMVCTAAFIFVVVDKPLNLSWRPLTVIKVKFTHDTFDHAELIIAIEYLKTLRQVSLLPMSSQ